MVATLSEQVMLKAVENYVLHLDLIHEIQNVLGQDRRIELARDTVRVFADMPALRVMCIEAAAKIKAPLVMITVIDDSQQFYLATSGAELAPEPREHSLCLFVAASATPFILNSIPEDSELNRCFAVQERNVRAYMGYPIRREGLPLGAFCAIDFESHDWTDAQRACLEESAAETTALIASLT